MNLRKYIRQILEEVDKKSLKSILNSNEAYEILDASPASGTMWTEGGCAILAFALNKAFGYPVYVIYDNTLGQVDHFVAKAPDGSFVDYYGPQKNILINFKRREMLYDRKLTLLPYNSSINISDIVIDDEASEKLAELIKNKKGLSEIKRFGSDKFPTPEYNPEELKSKFSDDYDFSKHSFNTGDCDIYAVSLHRLYGYPLYVVRGHFLEPEWGGKREWDYEDCHIVAKLPNGLFIDSDGEQGVSELKQNARFMNDVQKITIEPIDEETALNTFSCQDQEADIKQVMNYIKKKDKLNEGSVDEFHFDNVKKAIQDAINNGSIGLDDISSDKYFIVCFGLFGKHISTVSVSNKQAALDLIDDFKKKDEIWKIYIEKPGVNSMVLMRKEDKWIVKKDKLNENEENKMDKIIYEAYFVDQPSLLKQMFPPVHPNTFYHHMTIEFAPKELKYPEAIGQKIKLPIIGRLITDKVDVLLVGSTVCKKNCPHITLSTAEGVKPFESNKELDEYSNQIEHFDTPIFINATYGYFNGKKDVK